MWMMYIMVVGHSITVSQSDFYIFIIIWPVLKSTQENTVSKL